MKTEHITKSATAAAAGTASDGSLKDLVLAAFLAGSDETGLTHADLEERWDSFSNSAMGDFLALEAELLRGRRLARRLLLTENLALSRAIHVDEQQPEFDHLIELAQRVLSGPDATKRGGA